MRRRGWEEGGGGGVGRSRGELGEAGGSWVEEGGASERKSVFDNANRIKTIQNETWLTSCMVRSENKMAVFSETRRISPVSPSYLP